MTKKIAHSALRHPVTMDKTVLIILMCRLNNILS